MTDRLGPMDNPYRSMRVNREARAMDELKVKRLWSDISFGEINFANALRLRDRTLVPDFTFMMLNRCTVIPGATFYIILDLQ